MNGSIHQEDKTFINIYALIIGIPTYIKQILMNLKKGIDSNTITAHMVSTPITSMERSTRQKSNKETSVLSDMLDQRDLIDIYRPFHPKATEYTYFLSAHGTISRISHTWGHKTNLNKLKKTEI